VLITEGMICGSRYGLHSQNCRVRAGIVFMRRARPYLPVLLLYNKVCVEVSKKAVSRWDSRVLGNKDNNGKMLENIKSHKLDILCWIFRTIHCLSFLFMFKRVIHALMSPPIYGRQRKQYSLGAL
jgi:hypothetical protein